MTKRFLNTILALVLAGIAGIFAYSYFFTKHECCNCSTSHIHSETTHNTGNKEVALETGLHSH